MRGGENDWNGMHVRLNMELEMNLLWVLCVVYRKVMLLHIAINMQQFNFTVISTI